MTKFGIISEDQISGSIIIAGKDKIKKGIPIILGKLCHEQRPSQLNTQPNIPMIKKLNAIINNIPVVIIFHFEGLKNSLYFKLFLRYQVLINKFFLKNIF